MSNARSRAALISFSLLAGFAPACPTAAAAPPEAAGAQSKTAAEAAPPPLGNRPEGATDRAVEEPPTEWVEPSGHRVIRLSREPGSSSFYFHQNGYTAAGDKLVIATPVGLSTVNLKTRAIEPVVEGRAGQVVVGRQSRQVYYVRDDKVYSTHLDTRATRLIATLPPEIRRGSGLAVNADETLLA